MDLNVSPDLEAYFCYGIVFAAGAFVALGEVRRRLAGIEGVWQIARTWWLLAVYVAVPVILFWLLDRTGAINDTSVFAAILVGFGYERIIAGGDSPIRVSSGVSQFWTPFLAYAERIVKLAQTQGKDRMERLADKVIAHIGQDSTKIKLLEDLTKRSAKDIKALEDQIKEIEQTDAIRGAVAVTEDKVRVLYNVLLVSGDAHEQMLGKKIISWPFYWFRVRSLVPLIVAAAVILVTVIGYRAVSPEMKDYAANYYLWRATKTNSTAIDQFRTRQNLAALMRAATPELKERTMVKLADLLRQPSLPMERIDLVLQMLLENRDVATTNAKLPALLAQSLRGVGIDVRTRINDALRFLREYCKTDLDRELADWKPTDGDGPVGLERKIRRWEEYWAKPCEPPA